MLTIEQAERCWDWSIGHSVHPLSIAYIGASAACGAAVEVAYSGGSLSDHLYEKFSGLDANGEGHNEEASDRAEAVAKEFHDNAFSIRDSIGRLILEELGIARREVPTRTDSQRAADDALEKAGLSLEAAVKIYQEAAVKRTNPLTDMLPLKQAGYKP